jgi:hypothetical protein
MIMSIRHSLKKWKRSGDNPQKKEVLKNLNQILQLIESDSPYIAGQRIRFLISDIEGNKLNEK